MSLDSTNEKSNFKNENLENVAYAFAGLYILENEFIKLIANKEELELIQKSKLFEKERKIVPTVSKDGVADFSLKGII